MGKPRMDRDAFYDLIKEGLIDLIARELKDLRSARIQTTTWIRFRNDEELAELAFNSRMTDFFTGSEENRKWGFQDKSGPFLTFLSMSHSKNKPPNVFSKISQKLFYSFSIYFFWPHNPIASW